MEEVDIRFESISIDCLAAMAASGSRPKFVLSDVVLGVDLGVSRSSTPSPTESSLLMVEEGLMAGPSKSIVPELRWL